MTESNAYDTVPYESYPYAQSHPARMSGMAKLFALRPPALETARVLELGCSFGGNLLPVAAHYPNASFVGVDLSQVHIHHARRIAADLNVENVVFRRADILDLAKEDERYDYIIAHGVYSWVPPEVQGALLEICGRQLSADGVAYVSYNVYPGWKMREVVREMMLFHVGHLTDPKTKLEQARAILGYAAKLHSDNQSSFGRLMTEEAQLLMRSSDSYLYHDHLEANNRPCYFHEFAKAAASHGLSYLGESAVTDMLPDRYGPALANTAREISDGNIIACEQYVDLLTNRAFRQTLLVHSERMPQVERVVSAASLGGLHVSVQLDAVQREPGVDIYTDVRGRKIGASEVHTKAMIEALAAAGPYTVPFARLVEVVAGATDQRPDAAQLTSSALTELLKEGMATLFGEPIERPAPELAQVAPYARWHAGRGSQVVTNALHGLARLTPEQAQWVRSGEVPGAEAMAELMRLGVLVPRAAA